MVYGREPQLDPQYPSFTFTYVVTGAMGTDLSRSKAITVAAPTEDAARKSAAADLDRWHGTDHWKWRE